MLITKYLQINCIVLKTKVVLHGYVRGSVKNVHYGHISYEPFSFCGYEMLSMFKIFEYPKFSCSEIWCQLELVCLEIGVE